MAFKTLSQYTEDKNKDFFILQNDGDSADVIFLYRNANDVLVANTHYIKSAEYSGYVHCCGKGCPACAKNLRSDTKLFVPLFNYSTGKIEFWDRNTYYFEKQLMNDVISKYPNPSEWVFRITRHGQANSRDTRYQIVAVGKNSTNPYEKILADHNMTLPQGYEACVRDLTPSEMQAMLNSTDDAAPTSEYSYVPTPRASSNDYQPASTSIPEPVSVVPPAIGDGPAEYVPGMEAPVPEVPFTEGSTVLSPTDSAEESTDDLGDVNF